MLFNGWRLALWLIVAGAAACGSAPPAAESLRRGDELLAQNKLPDALIQYQQAVKAADRNAEARHKLGLTFVRVGDGQRATQHLVRAADLEPGNSAYQLDAARALLLAERFEDARTRAEIVVKADPTNAMAYMLRATATARLKDMDAAIEDLDEAIKLDPAQSAAIVERATLQLAQGQRAEAEAGFKQAIAVAPTAVQPRLALANYYWATGDRTAAEQAVKDALKAKPDDLSANRVLATLYLATGRAALAEEPLKRLADTTGASEAKLALADYYISQKRVAEARTILTAVASTKDASAAARGRLAGVEYDAGRRDQAHKMLSDILAGDPNNAGVLVVRGGWQLREGRLQDALQSAQAAIKADSRFPAAYGLLGQVQMGRNDKEEAIKTYTTLLQLQPRSVDALVALVTLNLSLNRLDDASRLARQAVATAPSAASPRLALARTLFAEGRLNEAEQELAPVVRAAPDSVPALGLQGLIRARRNDLAGARQSFDRASKLNPRATEPLVGLIGLDLNAKRAGDAVKRIEAALAGSPNDARLLLLAGRTYMATGDFARAEDTLRQAIQKDPSLGSAYNALAQLFVQQKKLDEARRTYESQLKTRPDDVGARTLVATMLIMQGKTAEAKAQYEQVLQYDSRAAVASNNLAYLDAEAGVNLDIALNRAQTAKAAQPDDPDFDDTLGWIYVKKGLPALAFAPLNQAIQKNPSEPLYHYHLGVAHLRAGDKELARASFQRALKLSTQFQGADEAKTLLDELRG